MIHTATNGNARNNTNAKVSGAISTTKVKNPKVGKVGPRRGANAGQGVPKSAPQTSGRWGSR